jgi:hypothetical protein
VTEMTDDDFVAAFLSSRLSPAAFHHRDHLRLARCLIRRSGIQAATSIITDGIRRFATQHGHADKYHETLTPVLGAHRQPRDRPEVVPKHRQSHHCSFTAQHSETYRQWR